MITFDQFHYVCGNLSEEGMREALELCLSTWGDHTPLTHHSSSRRIEKGDNGIKITAHADYIHDPIQTFGHIFDTDLEAKAKDKAVLHYLNTYMNPSHHNSNP